MKLQKTDKTQFILGLILVIVVYSCFAIFFVDYRDMNFIPRKLKHVISFVFLIVQYLVGFVFLRRLSIKWMVTIWNIVYGIGIITICSIGFYDWAILSGRANEELSIFARGIQEFLMAPILYVAMGLLHKALLSGAVKK
jgi:hypothetical protein